MDMDIHAGSIARITKTRKENQQQQQYETKCVDDATSHKHATSGDYKHKCGSFFPQKQPILFQLNLQFSFKNESFFF